ncbi:MAG: hypothetical protein ACI4K7_00250 [Oscillospiraceae bacterium]
MNEIEEIRYKNDINEAANEYYALSQNGASLTNSMQKLIFAVYIYLSERHKYSKKFSADSDLDILPIDTVLHLLEQKIQKWAPGEADFATYFLSFYYLRLKSELSRSNRTFSIDGNSDTDEDNPEDHSEIYRDRSPDAQVGDMVEVKCELTMLFSLLNENIRMQKKKYENSPRFCYPVRFYTEYTTRAVSELEMNSSREIIPEKTLDLIDRDFAEFYLQKNNEKPAIKDFLDIKSSDLRPLSDFTCNEADSSKKCGYQLKNIVYQKYIEKVKGKEVSASNISDQRTKFDEVLSQIRKEHSDV